MTQIGQCRSCPAKVRWAVTLKNAKPIPLDVNPSDDGNLVVFRGVAMSRKDADARGLGPLPLFTAHFATCPNANRHRKGT